MPARVVREARRPQVPEAPAAKDHRGQTRIPGLLLGIGLGGFVDGIVLHQLLQWHHMLTDRGFPPTSVENLKDNTLADGLFHVLTWIAVAAGIWLLWRGERNSWRWSGSGRALLGWMLVGWGVFNLV